MRGKARFPGDFVRVRLPTLEVFGLRAGAAFSTWGRTLTMDEVAVARRVFGHSIHYEPIRVITASVVSSPTTLGNYVRVLPSAQLRLPPDVLMHELTHVWQFQTRGMSYLSDSVCHQLAGAVTQGDRNAAYHITGQEILAAASIYAFSSEKQAMLVEYWFMNYLVEVPTPDGATTEWVAIQRLAAAQAMLGEVCAAQPLPTGYALDEAAWGAGMSTQRRQLPATLGHADSRADFDDDAAIPLLRLEF